MTQLELLMKHILLNITYKEYDDTTYDTIRAIDEAYLAEMKEKEATI